MKKKKNVKGMTLIEIIIAMFVFSVAGLLMVRVGSVAKNMMLSTNHLNNKIEAEAPVAAVGDKEALKDEDGNYLKAYQVDRLGKQILDDEGDPIEIPIETSLTITVGEGSTVYSTYNAKRYSTAAIGQSEDRTYSPMNGNLEFYELG